MRIVEDSPSHLRLLETSGRLPALLLAISILDAVAIVASHSDHRQFVNVAVFAAAALFFRRISRIDLDKSARRCGIWRLDMWRRSHRAIAFAEITNIQVEVMRPDTSVQSHSRLMLETSVGPIPLTAGFRTDLDAQIALREALVDVIFKGRPQPALLDPAKVLAEGGRPIAAALRA